MSENVQETQDLLDELHGPTFCSTDTLCSWMTDTTELVKTFGQQLALLRGLVHQAEDEEPTMAVRGKMEAIIQQVDAQTRILGNITKEARALRISRRSLHEQHGEFLELAAEAGYEMPEAPEPPDA